MIFFSNASISQISDIVLKCIIYIDCKSCRVMSIGSLHQNLWYVIKYN